MHTDNALMQRTAAIILGIAGIVALGVIAFLLMSPRAAEEPDATAEPTASPEPTPSATLNADLLERRWTVLYVGTDQNERREAEGSTLNTDALMLVSLSADQSQLTLVSLPRDTVDVPLPDGSLYDRKINGLYVERGMEALVGAMETLYGVPIDAYILLDMDDFAALVEAVDGVEVSPDAPLADPIVNIDLQPGPQELDASQTLGYVRTRVDKDYGRMGRQQEVLVALVEKLVDPETDLDLAALIDGLDSLETDVPLDQLPTLIELARRAADAEVQTLVIQQPLITFEGDRSDGRGYILEPDVEAIRAEVQELIGE
jgi:LCP family protein required for cell wall assembly